MVGPEALVARLTLGQRIGEGRNVTGGLPRLRRKDDRGVQAYDVVALLNHRPPPLTLDVVLELHAEGAVVPRRACASINLTAWEDEAPALAETDNGVDGGGSGHGARLSVPHRWCPPRPAPVTSLGAEPRAPQHRARQPAADHAAQPSAQGRALPAPACPARCRCVHHRSGRCLLYTSPSPRD